MAQQNRSKLSLPLAILSVVAMGAFFYALFVFSEPTQVTIAEEEGEQQALLLGMSAFENQMDNLMTDEQRVQIDGVSVAAVTAPSLFWFNLPDGSPFLVRIELELMTAGVTVEQGDVVNLTGHVREMSEQVLDQWMGAGVLPDDGARGMASTAEQYFLADDIQMQVPDEMMEEAEEGQSDPDDGDGA